MNIGISEIDITPQPGVELSGFAARIQPSTGVLDPLFAKALHLVDGDQQLLWIHCDLVGLDRSIVSRFRAWAREKLGLAEDQVMLSATHTHAGACTIYLQEAGQYDAAYVEVLLEKLRTVAQAAMRGSEAVEMVTVEGALKLAIDRRNTASAHIDPRVAAIGFRRPGGDFVAVVLNYAMHPVGLGAHNRLISADHPGRAAQSLQQQLPGKPIVLVTNGACANLNPPAENVPVEHIEHWGQLLAGAVAPLLKKPQPATKAKLRVLSSLVPLPVDKLDAAGINASADKALQDARSLAEWGEKYSRVVEHWRTSLLAQAQANRNNGHRDAELFAVAFGDVVLLGANAEVFSEFTDWVRRHTPHTVYLIGYANGDLGYLPTQAAYQEGGYEVEVAHMFYGGFRPKAGSLELLASAAADLVHRVHAGTPLAPTPTRSAGLKPA
jgi:neutral ceramidase